MSSGTFHEFLSRPLFIPRKFQPSSEKNENSKLLAVIARSCSSKTSLCLVFVLSSCTANTTESEKGKIEKCSWTRTSTKKRREIVSADLNFSSSLLAQISLSTQNNSVKKFDGFSHISLLLLPEEKKLLRSSLSDKRRKATRSKGKNCKIKIQHMTCVRKLSGQQHMMKRDKNQN